MLVKVLFGSVWSWFLANQWVFVVACVFLILTMIWEAVTRPTVKESEFDGDSALDGPHAHRDPQGR